jgi:hypothetical protein
MRQRLYSLHHTLKGLRTLSRSGYSIPPATDMVFVDAMDAATFNANAGYYHPAMQTVDGRIIPDSEVLLDRFLVQSTWRCLSRNELSLLMRGDPLPGDVVSGQGARLDGYHRLVAARFTTPVPGDTAMVTLGLEIEPDRKMVPWLSLILRSADSRDYVITKGPIGLGQPIGKLVRESWALRLPSSVPPGRYSALLRFYDPHAGVFPAERQRFQPAFTELGELTIPEVNRDR